MFARALVPVQTNNRMKYIKLYEQAQPEKSVTYYPDGSVESETWYQNGERHRDDEPTYIEYHQGGSVKYEAWSQNGKIHREDGPARIEYRTDGSIEYELWSQNDKLHREDGPAWISYRQDGSVEYDRWYWHGENVKDITSLEDFRAWQYLKSVGLV